MRINFNNVECEEVTNMHNGEGKVTLRKINELPSNIKMYALITIHPFSSIGLHYHTDDAESIYVLNGSAILIDDDKKEKLTKGDMHICYKNHKHSIINNTEEDLEIIAVVTKG